jgi:hypothetical protein
MPGPADRVHGPTAQPGTCAKASWTAPHACSSSLSATTSRKLPHERSPGARCASHPPRRAERLVRTRGIVGSPVAVGMGANVHAGAGVGVGMGAAIPPQLNPMEPSIGVSAASTRTAVSASVPIVANAATAMSRSDQRWRAGSMRMCTSVSDIVGHVAVSGRERTLRDLRDDAPLHRLPWRSICRPRSTTRLTLRVPWLCGPASRRVCFFEEAGRMKAVSHASLCDASRGYGSRSDWAIGFRYRGRRPKD